MEILWLAALAVLALGLGLSQAAPQGGGQQAVVTNSSDLSQALRNPQISLIVFDPSSQNVGGGRLPLEVADWEEPVRLQGGRYVTMRSVNGNPTVVDFGRLPWAIIIGANSTLELRDLIIHSYAPRSSASNTSHYYVGGLVSWPSISMAPSGVLKRYNTTQYFWSSTRYTRGDCQWKLAAALPGEEDFVTNKRSQQENITDERGITEILESGIFQASFAVSRFRFSDGVVTPIAPPVGLADSNSEGSKSLCVPDNSSYEAIAAQQYAAEAPATASAGVNVVGVAVGVSVAAVALIAAALTTAAVLMRRARRRRAAAECDKDSLPRGTHDNTPQGTGASLTTLPTMPGTGGSAGSDFELQLFKHGRLRRLGPLEEEQARPWGSCSAGSAHSALVWLY